jgi:hypothetical protein
MLDSQAEGDKALLDEQRGGTDNLPSMDLMVSSQTVATDTYTPSAKMMAFLAAGPRRGLSSRTHNTT